MSKNYELLRQAGKADQIFGSANTSTGKVSRNGHFDGSGEILRLIQQIFLSGAAPQPRLVAFSAVERGNGCSWLCARAGETLAAHIDGTVCLVDADFRMPSLHRFLGASDRPPQSEPSGTPAQMLGSTNLYLLPGGVLTPDSPATQGARELKTRLAELGSAFNYVLVDAPPVNDGAESLMIGQLVDGVVLVLEANSTHREAARRAKERLESANVRILGAVLNKRTFPVPEVLYQKL